MIPRKHTTTERIVNNVLYFAIRAFGGSFVVMWFAVLLFGFTNTMLFAYAAGITGTVFWEIERVRERRVMNTAILQYFGVPADDKHRALE